MSESKQTLRQVIYRFRESDRASDDKSPHGAPHALDGEIRFVFDHGSHLFVSWEKDSHSAYRIVLSTESIVSDAINIVEETNSPIWAPLVGKTVKLKTTNDVVLEISSSGYSVFCSSQDDARLCVSRDRPAEDVASLKITRESYRGERSSRHEIYKFADGGAVLVFRKIEGKPDAVEFLGEFLEGEEESTVSDLLGLGRKVGCLGLTFRISTHETEQNRQHQWTPRVFSSSLFQRAKAWLQHEGIADDIVVMDPLEEIGLLSIPDALARAKQAESRAKEELS